LENIEHSAREKQRKAIINLAGIQKLWEIEALDLRNCGASNAMSFDDDSMSGSQPGRLRGADMTSTSSEDSGRVGLSTSVTDFEEYLADTVPAMMSWTDSGNTEQVYLQRTRSPNST